MGPSKNYLIDTVIVKEMLEKRLIVVLHTSTIFFIGFCFSIFNYYIKEEELLSDFLIIANIQKIKVQHK